MTFYTSDGCAYEGMSEETVIELRNQLGRATTFVDYATYQSAVAEAAQGHP